jgi:hypothetical protein
MQVVGQQKHFMAMGMNKKLDVVALTSYELVDGLT